MITIDIYTPHKGRGRHNTMRKIHEGVDPVYAVKHAGEIAKQQDNRIVLRHGDEDVMTVWPSGNVTHIHKMLMDIICENMKNNA
jgi:hypothetical protein